MGNNSALDETRLIQKYLPKSLRVDDATLKSVAVSAEMAGRADLLHGKENGQAPTHPHVVCDLLARKTYFNAICPIEMD